MPSSWGNPWIQLGLDPGRFPIPSPGDIPNPGLKPRSPTLQILYHLSHQGNPRMLEWVAYPFSRDITVILSNLPASKLILHLKFTWSLVRGQAKIECPSKAYYKVHFVLISLHPKRQCGVIKHWFELKKPFFLCEPFLKVFIEFVTVLFLFHVLGFGHQAYGILAPQPVISLAPPALEGKVLTIGLPGKSLIWFGVRRCCAVLSHSVMSGSLRPHGL